MSQAIPFVAKRGEGERPWQEFGAPEPVYRRWAPEVCAMACCRSLILAKQGTAPDLWSLTQEALALGVYMEAPEGVRGAFHEPLVRQLAAYGLSARVFGRADEVKNLALGKASRCDAEHRTRPA